MSGTGVEIALIILATLRELNLAYFRLLETANLSDEEKAKLRAEFLLVNRDTIPKPEDIG
ncbi:MAG: hypothetical protein ACW99G_23705 [Candidatus Thorarchaeota archaeon]|jgi:hypothetical protein